MTRAFRTISNASTTYKKARQFIANCLMVDRGKYFMAIPFHSKKKCIVMAIKDEFISSLSARVIESLLVPFD